ncbi:hypothetical protein SLOPH_612 [Spraguea lophii 42_110]|uniref:Uncharacterized protein n=1 Tax=Spraguea lophii (strain 42_110) TaxID=1358809 RepID=S7XL50_SPRLO|nr:hypothetical protein SLOPH_612 [Spraguea lophii 42_110]
MHLNNEDKKNKEEDFLNNIDNNNEEDIEEKNIQKEDNSESDNEGKQEINSGSGDVDIAGDSEKDDSNKSTHTIENTLEQKHSGEEANAESSTIDSPKVLYDVVQYQDLDSSEDGMKNKKKGVKRKSEEFNEKDNTLQESDFEDKESLAGKQESHDHPYEQENLNNKLDVQEYPKENMKQNSALDENRLYSNATSSNSISYNIKEDVRPEEDLPFSCVSFMLQFLIENFSIGTAIFWKKPEMQFYGSLFHTISTFIYLLVAFLGKQKNFNLRVHAEIIVIIQCIFITCDVPSGSTLMQLVSGIIVLSIGYLLSLLIALLLTKRMRIVKNIPTPLIKGLLLYSALNFILQGFFTFFNFDGLFSGVGFERKYYIYYPVSVFLALLMIILQFKKANIALILIGALGFLTVIIMTICIAILDSKTSMGKMVYTLRDYIVCTNVVNPFAIFLEKCGIVTCFKNIMFCMYFVAGMVSVALCTPFLALEGGNSYDPMLSAFRFGKNLVINQTSSLMKSQRNTIKRKDIKFYIFSMVFVVIWAIASYFTVYSTPRFFATVFFLTTGLKLMFDISDDMKKFTSLEVIATVLAGFLSFITLNPILGIFITFIIYRFMVSKAAKKSDKILTNDFNTKLLMSCSTKGKTLLLLNVNAPLTIRNLQTFIRRNESENISIYNFSDCKYVDYDAREYLSTLKSKNNKIIVIGNPQNFDMIKWQRKEEIIFCDSLDNILEAIDTGIL